jgi:hypothetical protein
MTRRTLLTAACLTALTSSLAQAQSIQIDANGTVEIFGTNGHDAVQVEAEWSPLSGWEVEIDLEYPDDDGNGTDEVSEEFELGEISEIVFYGFDGDDTFYFDNPNTMANIGEIFPCYLIGGNGTDDLSGGPGNDYLDGGADFRKDTLEGGDGSDTFVEYFYMQKVKTSTLSPTQPTVQTKYKYSIFQQPPSDVTVKKVTMYENLVDFDPMEDEIEEREK